MCKMAIRNAGDCCVSKRQSSKTRRNCTNSSQKYPGVPFPLPEDTMIQQAPENLEAIRERLRKMSDLELRQYGRAARDLSNPKKNFGPPNPSFQIQLNEARAEWRRRHPKQ
jgi:hypothetical protein